MKKTSMSATLALILVTAAWGLTFTLIKNAVAEIPPVAFVAMRFLMASAILGLYLKLRPSTKAEKMSLKELRAGVVLGVFLFFGYALQTLGLQLTTASNAGFITGMSVVLVPLIALFTHSTVVRWNSWGGIALSVAGLTILSASSRMGVNLGDILILLCSLAFAFHIVYVGKYTESFDPARLTWIQITVCGVTSVFASLIFEDKAFGSIPFTLAQPKVFGALLFCALIATAGAYLIQNTFQRHSTPVRTALIFTCEPVFSAVFAYLLGGEKLLPLQLLGSSFLIFGMLSAELGEILKRKSAPNWRRRNRAAGRESPLDKACRFRSLPPPRDSWRVFPDIGSCDFLLWHRNWSTTSGAVDRLQKAVLTIVGKNPTTMQR